VVTCDGAQHLLEDVRLVRSQVARCRDVLDELSTEAARSPGESIVAVDVAELLERSSAEAGARVVLDVPEDLHAQVRAPRRALSRALRALLDNALQASADAAPVHLGARREGGCVVIEVSDSGEGMDEATLARVGEPFFTTKATGEGMGLGVLLTRTVIEEAGGSLSYRSREQEGTVARVELPAEEA
jgi:two-component system sensor histidine kinase RegB